jgi:hypothetical protein
MTHYATCVGCAFSGDCDKRRDMQASIKGLGITSLKFRCDKRRDEFQPGDAVWFEFVVDGGYSPFRGEYVIRRRFPGHVISQISKRVLGYVKPGVMCSEDRYPFEPMHGGVG